MKIKKTYKKPDAKWFFVASSLGFAASGNTEIINEGNEINLFDDDE